MTTRRHSRAVKVGVLQRDLDRGLLCAIDGTVIAWKKLRHHEGIVVFFIQSLTKSIWSALSLAGTVSREAWSWRSRCKVGSTRDFEIYHDS